MGHPLEPVFDRQSTVRDSFLGLGSSVGVGLTRSVLGDEMTRRFGPSRFFFLLSNQVTNQPALCTACRTLEDLGISAVLLLQDCTNTHLISTATIFCREAVGSYVFYTVAYIV